MCYDQSPVEFSELMNAFSRVGSELFGSIVLWAGVLTQLTTGTCL